MTTLGQRWAGSALSQWDALRASYWFIPTLMVVMAAGLALGLIELDDRIAGYEARRLPWIQDAGPEGTRALLSAVASSMITVTGVVFSITIVALTLASSNFGPRLLRNFLRDRSNQVVLGTFLATFLYSLLVLRAVEANDVPYLATAGALALAVASVFILIYFVHHAASSLQASSVIASVSREIENELPSLFPERLGAATQGTTASPPDIDLAGGSRDVRSPSSGYVRVLNSEGLLALAVEHDLIVTLARRPGDFVAEGELLARVAPGERADDHVVSRLRGVFVIGPYRTAVQDLGFLTDQLAEMAVRALSPGINDPKTAIACLHRLGAVLASVSDRAMPSADRYDDDGRLRVVADATTFADIVASCLDPIQRYGVHDAEVVETALIALARAAGRCPDDERRALLLEHAREWSAGFDRTPVNSKRDRLRVAAALDRVERAGEGITAPAS